MPKKSTQKFKYLENEESFSDEIKSIFLSFLLDLIKANKKTFFSEGSDFKNLHRNNKNIMSVVFSSLLLIFKLIQQAALVNFMLLLNILKLLTINLTFKILNEKLYILWLVGSFFLKTIKTFRKAQRKQQRLVKPCLISDLYFIYKTFGTALLETIISNKPLPILSQESRKTLTTALPNTSTTQQP